MEKISSLDLYKAKEKCLELQNTNNRLVLKGNKPILLTTTLLKNNQHSSKDYNMLEISSMASGNSVTGSYLDALIIWLNENYDINGVIDYLPVADDMISIAKQLVINRRYSDEEIKKLILEKDIQALFNLKVGGTNKNEPVALGEKISSYSFMGLTGISKELSKRLEENNLPNHMEFGGSFNDEEFKKTGYDYTDDTIAYNDLLFIGKIKGRPLPKEKIWPRSVEINFANEEDTYNLERIGGTLIEYFTWIERELKEKGPNDAMSPMKPKTYKKN